MRVCCPMCGGRCVATSSHLITATYRHAYVQCRNPACGWTGTAHVAIDATLCPGRAPRPEVDLSIPKDVAAQFLAALAATTPREDRHA